MPSHDRCTLGSPARTIWKQYVRVSFGTNGARTPSAASRVRRVTLHYGSCGPATLFRSLDVSAVSRVSSRPCTYRSLTTRRERHFGAPRGLPESFSWRLLHWSACLQSSGVVLRLQSRIRSPREFAANLVFALRPETLRHSCTRVSAVRASDGCGLRGGAVFLSLSFWNNVGKLGSAVGVDQSGPPGLE